MELDKKKLSERDICTKYITPALEAAGWDPQQVPFVFSSNGDAFQFHDRTITQGPREKRFHWPHSLRRTCSGIDTATGEACLIRPVN